MPVRPIESVTFNVKKNAQDDEPSANEKVHNIIRNNLQVLQDDNSSDQPKAQHDHCKSNESEMKKFDRQRKSYKKQVTILRPIRELFEMADKDEGEAAPSGPLAPIITESTLDTQNYNDAVRIYQSIFSKVHNGLKSISIVSNNKR